MMRSRTTPIPEARTLARSSRYRPNAILQRVCAVHGASSLDALGCRRRSYESRSSGSIKCLRSLTCKHERRHAGSEFAHHWVWFTTLAVLRIPPLLPVTNLVAEAPVELGAPAQPSATFGLTDFAPSANLNGYIEPRRPRFNEAPQSDARSYLADVLGGCNTAIRRSRSPCSAEAGASMPLGCSKWCHGGAVAADR